MSSWLSYAWQLTKNNVLKTPNIKPVVEEALDSWQVVTKKHSRSKSRKSTHGKSKHGKKKLEILPSIPEGDDETKNGGRRTRKIRKNKL